MATKHYQDFVGLNTFIYESSGYDDRTFNGEIVATGTIGSFTLYVLPTRRVTLLELYENDDFLSNFSTPPADPDFFNMLMSHRGNVYGYPTWRQVRSSHNPLTRKQRKENIFSYTQEPGPRATNGISKYGLIRTHREPVVTDTNKPVSLIGEVSTYNEKLNEFQNRSVELKTSFGNETAFFANPELNDYYDTIAETDDNYEQLKELYVDGGLEDDGSPIDAFNLFIYRQSVYPKQQYCYLNATRSRTFFVNSFWREERNDRTQTSIDTDFGATVPSQSMWPLDVSQDWSTRAEPSIPGSALTVVYNYYIGGRFGGKGPWFSLGGQIDGFNTGEDNLDPALDTQGGSGILMNSYSHLTRGNYNYSTARRYPELDASSMTPAEINSLLSASCYYSKRHTLNGINSVVAPAGMQIHETASLTHIATGSLFEGLAHWDAATQAQKEPFYRSYASFAEETRLKGKGYSIVPEFRISNHVENYYTKGVTEELLDIFELSGALSSNSTTQSETSFYKVLSTTDFLKHFDLVKKDHKDLGKESILTLRCKAIKKFLPYDGFYPAEETVNLAKTFYSSYKDSIVVTDSSNTELETNSLGVQAILEPFFAPGILFNTIKSGVAVDYPIILPEDNPVVEYANQEAVSNFFSTDTDPINVYYIGSDINGSYVTGAPSSDQTVNTIFSKRIDFESLVEPSKLLKNIELSLQEPHPFGLSELGIKVRWDGTGKDLYVKKANNFLSEVSDFFLKNSNMKTIVSLEDGDPNFGNAIGGNYYTTRVKMYRSKNKPSNTLLGIGNVQCFAPQDVGTEETLTMYSRPSAFGAPLWGSADSGVETNGMPLDPVFGNNYCFTPPYYYGESWCDLIFYAASTKKYTLNEIMNQAQFYPYYTRFWSPYHGGPIRDLTGYQNDGAGAVAFDIIEPSKYSSYSGSRWKTLINIDNVTINGNQASNLGLSNSTITSTGPANGQWIAFHTEKYVTEGGTTSNTDRYVIPPHHPVVVNYNAMQLDSSVNLFGKGIVRKTKNESTQETIEVASSDTVEGKTRWIIQTKFETPILNFNKYTDLSANNCTLPQFASESVPRGMWHQYGEIPQDPEVGVFMQVEDMPESWLAGALGLSSSTIRSKVKSLADLVGFQKEPVRLGEVADVKEISEAVVAVPFIEKDGTRQFFSIPREDIDSCIGATKREVDPGTFVAGGPPKAGDSVYQMVKKMQKYVFPPSMDFVKYKEIDPFAMYVFEFKHNLSKQDLADIWQNLPPDIGTKMEEAEATISHELLAHELLGGGAVVKNGVLDDNAEGNGIPSNIQWMIFKAKKRAKTNYFDKVVAKKGTTEDTSNQQLENAQGQIGNDLGITYNWPYDFFSLVELVKIDAEVTFANIENDDKGQKTIKKVEKKNPLEVSKSRAAARGINIARGKGKPNK